MFGHGKCPKCGTEITRCDLDQVTIGGPHAGPMFHGAAACCPTCKTVLGVTIDPLSLAADIARQVARQISEKTG